MVQDSTTPEKKEEKYIGPGYKKGILLPSNRLVKPREMNKKQREALIKEYPRAVAWWA